MDTEYYSKWEIRLAATWLILLVMAFQTWLIIDGQWYVLPLTLLIIFAVCATMAAIGILIGRYTER